MAQDISCELAGEITPVQEKKIRIAVESTCERCHDYFPGPFLEVHRISRRRYREMARDPSARILVVCHQCHHEIHTIPVLVRQQRAIVQRRTFFVRRDLRKVLGYTPPPYVAPVSVNLAQVYEEYLGRSSPGAYRMSG